MIGNLILKVWAVIKLRPSIVLLNTHMILIYYYAFRQVVLTEVYLI